MDGADAPAVMLPYRTAVLLVELAEEIAGDLEPGEYEAVIAARVLIDRAIDAAI